MFILGSEGHAQFLLAIAPESKCYVTIRALTGRGNALDSSTNGVTVDRTPPDVEVISFGLPATEMNSSIVYQRDGESVSGEWLVDEPDSQLMNMSTTVIIGTAPGKINTSIEQ